MTAYAGPPLSAEQRREVLRVMYKTAADERRNYRRMLIGERDHARHLARDYPKQPQHAAAADAYDRALELLHLCWPVLDLPVKAEGVGR